MRRLFRELIMKVEHSGYDARTVQRAIMTEFPIKWYNIQYTYQCNQLITNHLSDAVDVIHSINIIVLRNTR